MPGQKASNNAATFSESSLSLQKVPVRGCKLLVISNRRGNWSKTGLRYIKRNEASLCKESLASKLADGDSKSFWKQIKGDSNVRVPLPTSVEGVTGEANIANLWRTHYKYIFNTTDEGCRAANYVVCNNAYMDIQVLYDELSSAIDYLDTNSACGLGGVYAGILNLVPIC